MNDTGGGGAGGTNHIDAACTDTISTYNTAPAGNGKIEITFFV